MLVVVPACIVGELLYVAHTIFRQTGNFDLVLAAKWFVPFLLRYPTSWIVGKLIVIGGTAFGCYKSVGTEKKIAFR